jgi:hypothetical protein
MRGREDTQYMCHDIVEFCCMARRIGGKERALCGKPIEAIKALAQRKRENGDTARVRFRVRKREEDGIILLECPAANRCDEHGERIKVIRVNCTVAGVPRFGGRG